jgi:putative transposase
MSRRSLRLKGYDYPSAGAYYLTVCTQNKECLFGRISKGTMFINEYGDIVADEWSKSSKIRHEIELDEFMVMPNHFHAIVFIHEGDQPVAPTNCLTGPVSKSIGALMAGFKSSVTKRINGLRQTPGVQVWQRNYDEHVIRNENDMTDIREYIHYNVAKWELDEDFRP